MNNYFITSPKDRRYIDADKLDLCAGMFEGIAEQSEERNRLLARCGATCMRMMQTSDYATATDFIVDFLYTLQFDGDIPFAGEH